MKGERVEKIARHLCASILLGRTIEEEAHVRVKVIGVEIAADVEIARLVQIV